MKNMIVSDVCWHVDMLIQDISGTVFSINGRTSPAKRKCRPPITRGLTGESVGNPGGTPGTSAEHVKLVCILAVFALLASLWAFAVPIPRGPSVNPDETSHAAYVEYIARNRSLPPYTIQYYESVHPPLYYALAAAFTWAGMVGVRFVNVVIGCLALLTLYRLARLYPRGNPLLCVGLLAFLPMFVTECGSITNDILAVFLGTLGFYHIVLGYRTRFDAKRTTFLALTLAAGLLTKYQCLAFVPAAIVAMVIRRSYRQCLSTLFAVAALSGWWYVRNVLLFGDPFRQHAEQRLLGFLAGFPDVQVSPAEYWGRAVISAAVSVPGLYRDWLPLPIYVVYGVLILAAIAGIVSTKPRPSPEWLLLALPVAFAGAFWISYNYHHFMPQTRLLYPVVAVPCLLGARALRRLPTGIVIVPLALCALTVVMTMPKMWIDPTREVAYRRTIMPFRQKPFPTSETPTARER